MIKLISSLTGPANKIEAGHVFKSVKGGLYIRTDEGAVGLYTGTTYPVEDLNFEAIDYGTLTPGESL